MKASRRTKEGGFVFGFAEKRWARSRPVIDSGRVGSRARTMSMLSLALMMLLTDAGSAAAGPRTGAWEPIGPRAATVFALARDPFDNARLIVGTHFGGLYQSTDGGLTWSHLLTPFSDDGVFDVEFVPTSPLTMYVGTESSGIFRSADNGATWNQSSQGLGSNAIRTIAVSPLNHQIVLAGGFEGVFRSSDAGASWRAVASPLDPFPAVTLVFDPLAPDTVYAATQGRGVYRSTDAGISWEAYSQGIGERTMTSLSWDVNDPDRLLASATEGVFALRRGGTKWLDLSEGLPTGGALGVNTVVGDDRVYASNDLGVFVLDIATIQGRKTPSNRITPAVPAKGRLAQGSHQRSGPSRWHRWYRHGARFVASDVSGSVIHVANTFDTFRVTADGGKTFFPADRGIQNLFCGALATMSAEGVTGVYAGTGNDIRATSELYQSDGVFDWEPQEHTIGAVFELAPDPGAPGTLYAGTEGRGVLRTTNFGMDWEDRSNGLVPPRITALEQGPDNRSTLYAGTNAGIFVSDDHGETWTGRFQSQNPARITAIRADHDFLGWAYYGTSDGRVYRTQSSGREFFQIWTSPIGERIEQIDIAPYSLVYCVGSSGTLYASANPGEQFFPRGADDIDEDILCVGADPQRPWIAYVGTRFGGVYRTESSAISWENHSAGIDPQGSVFSIAVDRENPDTIYAGSEGKVYKSQNQGASWSVLPLILANDAPVVDIRIDPIESEVLYVRVIDRPREEPPEVSAAGIYRSPDGGATWEIITDRTPFDVSSAVLPSVTEPGRVYVGSELRGVHRSDDNGRTWTASNDGLTPIVLGLAVSPSDGQTVYAATADSGVFRSSDAGANWSNIGLRDFAVFHIAIDPSDSSRILASTSVGPMLSVDAGDTWGLATQENPYVFTVASDPTDRAVVYVGGFGSLMRSDDAGRTWNFIENGLPHVGVNALAVDPNDHTVYAGLDEGGVYRSSDSGKSWWPVGGEVFAGLRVTCLGIEPESGAVYAGVWGGLLKSTDRGDSWEAVPIDFGQDYPGSIAIQTFIPQTPIVLVSVLNEQGPNADPGAPIYRSINGGQTWQQITNGLNENDAVRVLATLGGAGQPLFAATKSHVYRSMTLGATWQAQGSIPGAEILDIAVDDGSTGALFAATDLGMYRSTDSGATWTPVPIDAGEGDAPVAHRLAARGPGALYAGTTTRGVFATSDAGTTWNLGVTQSLAVMTPHAMAFAPADPSRVVAATAFGGVAISDDRGENWSFKNNGLGASQMFAVVVDPGDPDVIYASSEGAGVWVSEDGGNSWNELNEGLFHKFVTALAIDVNDADVLYAGTEGGGVFRLRRR